MCSRGHTAAGASPWSPRPQPRCSGCESRRRLSSFSFPDPEVHSVPPSWGSSSRLCRLTCSSVPFSPGWGDGQVLPPPSLESQLPSTALVKLKSRDLAAKCTETHKQRCLVLKTMLPGYWVHCSLTCPRVLCVYGRCPGVVKPLLTWPRGLPGPRPGEGCHSSLPAPLQTPGSLLLGNPALPASGPSPWLPGTPSLLTSGTPEDSPAFRF